MIHRVKSNNPKKQCSGEIVLTMMDYAPLESAYSVLKYVFRQAKTKSYIVDFVDVNRFELPMLGVLVLLKRHALDTGARFEVRNKQAPEMRVKSEQYLSMIK